MYTLESDVKQAPRAWFAAQDASMRSAVASTAYTEKEKVRAERLKAVLEQIYHTDRSYITYRKRFIAVKVEKLRACVDPILMRELEADWAKEGITKVVTAQGITYRIPKK